MKHFSFLIFVSCFDWEITHTEKLQLPNGHRDLRGPTRRTAAQSTGITLPFANNTQQSHKGLHK